MDGHFIESCEDERDVLRKIKELKKIGYTESDMYVVARSNEQLTMIRTRTDVDYHVAEVKGMGRGGIFIRDGSFLKLFTEITSETKESAYYYQQLLDGKLLLYCGQKNLDCAAESVESSTIKEEPERKFFLSRHFGIEKNEEDRILIDSRHYEKLEALQVDSIQQLPEQKNNNNKKMND